MPTAGAPALATATVSVAAALLAGCGDSEPPPEPGALLDAALARPISAATVEAEVELHLEGAAAISEPIELTLDGPVVLGEAGDPPDFDLAYDATLEGLGVGGRLISFNGNAYVDLFGEVYEVGEERVAAARSLAPEIELSRWLGKPKDLGSEEVTGTDTRHLSAPLDGAALAEDVATVESVEAGTVDLWVDPGDETVRRLRVEVAFTPAPEYRSALRGATGADLNLDVVLSDLGEEQLIEVPPGPKKPIEDLLERLPAFG